MPEELIHDWTALILAGLVALMAIGLMFAASFILSSRRRSAEKEIPYECGIPPTPYAFSQISIRYYIFAILFLIFDVEAVFLFPWAVVFYNNDVAFYAMMIFLAVLLFAVVYGWKKGVLEWRK
ncbi:NADH-quinone oxidoreductase subunit A [SAR202 cluster bacterium AD-804-J14_MRT_500m]|nr:NADH-quinone oxidoreductase subunit A [SAR202 cluster bacterium AD-804-J14_MRT_500m]